MSRALAFLIALAMVFAPFAVESGSAHAAMPAGHAGPVEASHCGDEGKVDLDVEHGCCAAMCASVALAPALSADGPTLTERNDQPAAEQSGLRHSAKLPTPPTRAE